MISGSIALAEFSEITSAFIKIVEKCAKAKILLFILAPKYRLFRGAKLLSKALKMVEILQFFNQVLF